MRSLKFNNVYINNYYSMLGNLEHNPVIAKKVDKVVEDYYMGSKCPEEGEAEYQKVATIGLLKKMKLKEQNIDLLIGGDLQNQIFSSIFNATNFNIPFLGVYSACASFAEGLIISASMIEGKFLDNALVTVSSSNLVSEKQFRFPVEYGALRKKANSFSATGAVSTYLSNKKGNIKVESATIGRVIDMGHTDANDMGACMAPGVAEVLYDHFTTMKRNPSYYDIILTGDLGVYGVFMLKEYMMKKYKIRLDNVIDAGAFLYNCKPGGTFAGGSGPVCAPLMLLNDAIYKHKKILLVASGALHSCTSVNLKKPMPGIGHAVSLEVLK